jgi:hypothetical protein
MEPIAKKSVSRPLMLVLFLFIGCLALPLSTAAQNYPQAVVLEQKMKETARTLEQGQKDEALVQKQAKTQRRVTGEFASLLVKATAQHAKMKAWQKARSGEYKTKARGGIHGKRLHCWLCF